MATQAKVETDSKLTTMPRGRELATHGIKTTIHDHVVAKIAGLAVREVEGVHALVPYGAGQTLSKFANELRGADMRDLGVHVEVGSVEVAVDMRIITEYGVSIPKVAEAARERVTRRVEEMTGLKVAEITLEVVDLYFPGDTEAPEIATTSRVR